MASDSSGLGSDAYLLCREGVEFNNITVVPSDKCAPRDLTSKSKGVELTPSSVNLIRRLRHQFAWEANSDSGLDAHKLSVPKRGREPTCTYRRPLHDKCLREWYPPAVNRPAK